MEGWGWRDNGKRNESADFISGGDDLSPARRVALAGVENPNRTLRRQNGGGRECEETASLRGGKGEEDVWGRGKRWRKKRPNIFFKLKYLRNVSENNLAAAWARMGP